MAEIARYVYAVAGGIPPDALVGVAGIGGAPVESVEHRGLHALVSDVDLTEYGEEGLRRNLEDLRWLEETARAHDTVVHAATAAAPTAPMRLATIFFDDDGVRRFVEELYDDLRAALDRVRGRAEWSVKVLTSPRAAAPEPTAAPTGGADYLRRKKAQNEARHSAESVAVEAADRIADAIAGAAVAVRRLPPQDPSLSGHQGTMLLNLAALVGLDDSDAFAARLEALADAEDAVSVVVAGPWPPYSFATLEAP